MRRRLRVSIVAVIFSVTWALAAAGACGNLTGSWKCEDRNCSPNGKLAKVIQDGDKLTFINGGGEESSGRFENEFKVVAIGWIHNGEPLEGILVEDEKCRKIHWKNGSTWVRQK